MPLNFWENYKNYKMCDSYIGLQISGHNRVGKRDDYYKCNIFVNRQITPQILILTER